MAEGDADDATAVDLANVGDRRHRRPEHHVVRDRRLGLAASSKDLQRNVGCLVGDDEARRAAARVALAREVRGQLRLLRVRDAAGVAHQLDLVPVELVRRVLGGGRGYGRSGERRRGRGDGGEGRGAQQCAADGEMSGVGGHAATVRRRPNRALTPCQPAANGAW